MKLLTVDQAADFLGLNRYTVYRMVSGPDSAERIPHIRIGTSIRIPEEKLIEWLEKKIEDAA